MITKEEIQESIKFLENIQCEFYEIVREENDTIEWIFVPHFLLENKMKKVPNFWWDFRSYKNKPMSIIIQSDFEDYDNLGEKLSIEENIQSAEKFISDLKAGRKDFVGINGLDFLKIQDILSTSDKHYYEALSCYF